MSKKSRSKGQRGEREVVKMFQGAFGGEFYRVPLSGGWASKTTQGQRNAHGDLVSSDSEFPFSVEVKNCEGWNLEQMLTAPKSMIYSWIDQTLSQTPEGKIPLLCFTRNRQPFFYLIPEKHAKKVAGTAFIVSVGGTKYKIGLLEDFLERYKKEKDS